MYSELWFYTMYFEEFEFYKMYSEEFEFYIMYSEELGFYTRYVEELGFYNCLKHFNLKTSHPLIISAFTHYFNKRYGKQF